MKFEEFEEKLEEILESYRRDYSLYNATLARTICLVEDLKRRFKSSQN